MDTQIIDKKLPVYALVIDPNDESGVSFIAMVDKPAIEKNWMAFNKQDQKFAIINKDKRIVAGALMIPDLPIYRRDDMGEYYVIFTADTISQIVQKFAKTESANNVNIMHDDSMIAKNVYLFQHMIVDKANGINPSISGEVPDGSWYGYMKVDNPDIWDGYVKTGILNGFSVEGIFQHKYLVDKSENQIKTVSDRIQGMRKELEKLRKLHNTK